MARTGFAAFVRQVMSTRLYRPDGTADTRLSPAVWTLAHRGHSGQGRLDLWVYPRKAAALKAGATLAMECGLDEDPTAQGHFARAHYQKVLDRYEQLNPEYHLLRVLPAWIQLEDDHDGVAPNPGP